MNDDKRKLAKLCVLVKIKRSKTITVDMYQDEHGSLVFPWDPFTNIEQAIMVADKFYTWKVGRDRLDSCYISHIRNFKDLFWGEGYTPAEAICRAALSALEEG